MSKIKNQLKTGALLAVLTVLMLVIGRIIGGFQGMTIALVFALGINFISYWFSDKIVLAMYHAKEIKSSDDPDLFSIVKGVSTLASIPMPKVYKIPSKNPNAFATGRNPKNSAVALTAGILDLLSKEELKAVIAHEISHIKNRDTLIQTISATLAGVISYIAMIARWGAIFGGFGGDRDNSNIIELLVLAILAPLIATMIQLAISRSREFLADETGAKTIHNPLALASALEKLDKAGKLVPLRSGNPATSALFISNPFNGGFSKLFSTHPPMQERIKRLKSM